jgi:hypothetical protein
VRNGTASEELWVNFKLFGMMGLTIVFVIAQAFYLARHLRDDDPEQPDDRTASERRCQSNSSNQRQPRPLPSKACPRGPAIKKLPQSA